TRADAAPTSTVTAGTCGAMIVLAETVGAGRPIVKPVSVSPNESGSANTGCGSAPNTRPEYQRLVGGTTPSARRTGSILATARSGTAATSAAVSVVGGLASTTLPAVGLGCGPAAP